MISEIIKQDFFGPGMIIKYCFGPGHKFKRNGPKKLLLEDLLDAENPVWNTFLQTPNFLDYMQF